jgi:hypothetical protein
MSKNDAWYDVLCPWPKQRAGQKFDRVTALREILGTIFCERPATTTATALTIMTERSRMLLLHQVSFYRRPAGTEGSGQRPCRM